MDISQYLMVLIPYRGRCPQPKRGPQKYEVLFLIYKTH